MRARATSEESINNYFQELKRILDKYDFINRPEAIYNVDEKGIQQNFKPPLVVSDTDSTPTVIISERSSTTTVIGCGNALGQAIPPYFVFAGARMRQELLEGCTHGTDGTVSQSGWSNAEIFHTYLTDHFHRYSTPRSAEKPLLLLYDGHRSHITPNLIDWAVENNIILYVLPPHTSHILQPMDVGCFGPFSKIYSNECLKFQRSHGATVTHYTVCSLACKAYAAALSQQNLQSAFRRSGIHPYNPDSIPRSLFVISNERHTQVSIAPVNVNVQINPSSPLPDVTDATVDNISDDVIVPETETSRTSNNKCKPVDTQKDDTDVSDTFFQKKRPVFRPPFKVQRKSISSIIAGKAITENDVSEKVKSYYQDSRSKYKNVEKVKVSTGKSKSLTRKGKSPVVKPQSKKQCSSLSSSTSRQAEPGPSGLQHISESDDSENSTQLTQDDNCCVCHRFQPEALERAVSLVFTQWGECMYTGCGHWVHLKHCCNVRVLRRHDTFYCPCHGLPCKPVEE